MKAFLMKEKGWNKENINYFNFLHVMFQLVPFPLQHLALIFSGFSFAAAVAVEAHLADLHIPQQV